MEQPSTPRTDRFQWKWVGIPLIMYLLFWFVPILLSTSPLFIGVWFFAGPILLAGISGYLSKGVTLVEPVVGSLGFVLLMMVYFAVKSGHLDLSGGRDWRVFLTLLVGGAFLTFIGAWLGERVQALRGGTPAPTPPTQANEGAAGKPS